MATVEPTSDATSVAAPSEGPVSVPDDIQAPPTSMPASFPPYPPYATQPAPPSVADTIHAGREMRLQHKSTPKTPVWPPPKPARPRGPKATDVKMSKRAMRAHASCLRRHGAVLTDRLEYMAKPTRRNIIYLWREHANKLPPETIARLRAMLDADEPFKPDQAYEYFVNLRKTRKRTTTMKVNQIKKDVMAICADKRFVWARNATVTFARGIQQRLSRPGSYTLADGMLRLSNIILHEMCGYTHMRTPSRLSTHPKAKFMMEMSDKVAIWIDEILSESEDRMLMMDFDEDNDITGAEAGDAGFADDFLNMMGGGGLLKGPQHAYLRFSGEMLEAFMVLTNAMYGKGGEQLISHGKFNQTYKEGADELKQTPDFEATDFNLELASKLNEDLNNTAAATTPPNLKPFMKDMVEICGNYLAQNAEFNKDKGPAFKLLVKTMRTKPNELLYNKGKATRNFGAAATELDTAKGLESDHDDPNLSQEIHSKLSKTVESITPDDLKGEMKETLDICSKYLSQRAVDEIERGPAFDLLIKQLEKHGGDPFTPKITPLSTKFAAAYTLKSAPGFSSSKPDPSTVPLFTSVLHKCADVVTPATLTGDMNEVIGRCANYLSAFARDRDKAMEILLKAMKSNEGKEFSKRKNYTMSYGTGVIETEKAPMLIPFLPIKDIADEGKKKLSEDVKSTTPPELNVAMKSVVQDVSRHLSQPVAIRSRAAGERYPLNFLANVKKSLGERPLFKYKVYGQTYSDAADVLKYSGPLEHDPKYEDLRYKINSEINRGAPDRIASTITSDIQGTIDDASKHLAKVGGEKGNALDHLVTAMKKEGDVPLGILQGYEQSHGDGARRIENARSLKNEKVEKGAYESVRGKLTNLFQKNPSPETDKYMPGVIEESAKFLAAPLPETEEEKRRVLADLMARKGETQLAQEGIYKITYTEAGEEIINGPVGVVTCRDEGFKKGIVDKMKTEIPEKKLQDVLRVTVAEGGAHLTDVVKGRGEAMQAIHDGLKKERSKDFLTVGQFNKNHDQAADMLKEAPHFGGQYPAGVLLDRTTEKIKSVHTEGAPPTAQEHMGEATTIASTYIAGVATKECGLDAKALAEYKFPDSPTKQTAVPSKSEHLVGVTSDMDEEARRRAEEEARKRAEEEARRRAEEEGATSGLDDEARRRLEEERRRREAEARRLDAERHRRSSGRPVDSAEFDPERDSAMQILHAQLRAHGNEILYKQPHTELTHSQASDWLSMKPSMKVDKTVKESGDTARLHKKFERKLSTLVSKRTPSAMHDTMQDVIIESSRILSEYFVSKNYKALVREALISEKQKRGNEILAEVDGAAETYFFAAQRLKKAESLDVKEPCNHLSYYLTKKLEDMIRSRSMARKLTASMKDHIKEASDYLSEMVTKPDEQIEAYVALLGEMESAGDSNLIEGSIQKSFKDSAQYLRQLTTFKDLINRPDSSLQSSTESKLKALMANVTASGYTPAVMGTVIADSTRLLVSYIMLQVEKTEALKILIEQMDQAGESVLLRHGTIRKSYLEGADILRGKNTDQLGVHNADPVVARKIQIKLHNLMHGNTPEKFHNLMDDVIEDATMYLAVHFLRPQIIQVCKCMKNVFVQCELWCDEILRRVARPCCTCSRHVSAQALADLAPAQRLRISPGSSRAFAPGLEISLTQCPSRPSRSGNKSPTCPCPAAKPTPGCEMTTSYLLYSTTYNQQGHYNKSPTSFLPESTSDSSPISPSPNAFTPPLVSSLRTIVFDQQQRDVHYLHRNEPATSLRQNDVHQPSTSSQSFHTPATSTDSGTSKNIKPLNTFWQSPTTMYARVHMQDMKIQAQPAQNADHIETPIKISAVKSGYSSRAPIVSTDQMSDWHAMMVSLMWNVQAWRDWIQENIERALTHGCETNVSLSESEESWLSFQRRVTTEALQWRQYNNFSRQLTLRLALRYRDKQIVSPSRATVKTAVYMDCQKEMLEIIEMFNRWTRWLTVIVKETGTFQPVTGIEIPLHEQRWSYFKKKVEEYSEDWFKYNMHLKVCWEHRYRMLIADWLPAWQQPGPVWVVSACGAVPSGAVAAGVFDGEVIWVARTTHRCNVLPAALHPSKHCCLVYADGATHHYTKYQVMCNAAVSWVAWRAGAVGARAVRVARGVHVGRVLYRGSHLLGAVRAPAYRCHVLIYGRPFAFNCYELLVLAGDDDS